MAKQLPQKLLGLILLAYCTFQSYYVYAFEGDILFEDNQMANGILYALGAAIVIVGLAIIFDKERIKHEQLTIRKTANRSWSYLIILAMYAGIITAVSEILI